MPGRDQSGQPVTLVIESGKLLLRSRLPSSDDWVGIPVPGASVAGPDQRVCLNRTFITKALRFGFLEFQVTDALSPVLFTAPGKQFLAMVMRLEETPAIAQADSRQPPPQPAATPPEAAEPATPSAAQPETPTEHQQAMATNNITMPAPERGNLKALNGSNSESSTALKAVVDQVEKIKTNLRDVISDLNGALDLLKAAEKEKKATLKEVESVRATLRSLQKVEL